MKTQLILAMYDLLFSGKGVERKLFCADHGISERTFYRYIREINIFLMHSKRDYVLKIDEPAGFYYMEKMKD